MLKGLIIFYGLLLSLYGLYCFFEPIRVTELIGYVSTTGDARAEFLAMYAGVQIAVGLFAIYSLFDTTMLRATILLLGVVFFFLALFRMLGFLEEDSTGIYTHAALIFETFSAAVFLFAFFKQPRPVVKLQ